MANAFRARARQDCIFEVPEHGNAELDDALDRVAHHRIQTPQRHLVRGEALEERADPAPHNLPKVNGRISALLEFGVQFGAADPQLHVPSCDRELEHGRAADGCDIVEHVLLLLLALLALTRLEADGREQRLYECADFRLRHVEEGEGHYVRQLWSEADVGPRHPNRRQHSPPRNLPFFCKWMFGTLERATKKRRVLDDPRSVSVLRWLQYSPFFVDTRLASFGCEPASTQQLPGLLPICVWASSLHHHHEPALDDSGICDSGAACYRHVPPNREILDLGASTRLRQF
mmetsp:Transcript_63511/g.149510  ORF Transcript_63511/g.149510 Transcript_63511/m.149510 type:complete len:288 (+) Transcript_63511:817-1680(+)